MNNNLNGVNNNNNNGKGGIKMNNKDNKVVTINRGLKLESLIERFEELKKFKQNRIVQLVKRAGYSVVNNDNGELVIYGACRYNKIYNSILSIIEAEKEIAVDTTKVKLSKEEKIEAIKSQLSKNITTAKQLNYICNLENEFKYELLKGYNDALNRKYRPSYVNKGAINHKSKEIPVVLIRRIEIDVEKVEHDYNTVINNYVQPCQESELIRALDTNVMTMCDSSMSLTGEGTNEICTLSLGKGLLNNNNYSRSKLKKIFRLLLSDSDESITVIISRSGLARIAFDNEFKLMPGEIAYGYKVLGITPSGFRSGSLMLGAITESGLENGVKITNNIDRRTEVLNNSTDGAFAKEFMEEDENGNLRFAANCDDLVKLFKMTGRVLLSATASNNMGEISNYIVLKNIAQKAMYFENDYNTPCNEGGVDCSETKDGAIFASTEVKMKYLINSGVPATIADVMLDCDQTRGGGTKDSAQYLIQKDLVILIKSLLRRGTEVEYIVYNGKKTTLEELEASDDLDDFFKNLQVIADSNAMKLLNHNEVWNMLGLKQAHVSETSLNMVINIAMLLQDPDGAKNLLFELGKKKIYDKFEELGFVFNIDEDGVIEDVSFDFEKLQKINNDSQIANLLYKLNPLQISAAMPQLFKSILMNNNIAIKNLIKTLSIEVDSSYMVIQSDIAPLFGVRLLNDGEVYCAEFEGLENVSAARHPISGPYAISTFKPLTKEVLLERINNLKVDNDVKELLIRRIATIKDFVEIPASHYYQEKHDGMDFDIDAMQFFKEKSVVDILKNIPDIGTVIKRSFDIEADICTRNSEDELSIQVWKDETNKPLTRKTNKKSIKEQADFEKNIDSVKNKYSVNSRRTTSTRIKKTSNAPSINRSSVRKQINGKYSVDFDSVTNLIFDYFTNPVDPVGFISTGFYNNALLFLVMISKKTDMKLKQSLANIIKNRFGCSGLLNKYISPVERKVIGVFNGKQRTEVILHKGLCTEVMMRYAESKGTVEDTIAFLADICICNRYPAETSIDAAKNMYAIVDMFNMGRVVKALGSDKNMKTSIYGYKTEEREDEMVTSNNLYTEIIESFNEGLEEGVYSPENFFNVGLLYNGIGEAFNIEGLTDEEIKYEISIGKIPAVIDPLAEIRLDLTDIANDLIVLCSKEMENYVRSNEAKEIRSYYVDKYVDMLSDKDKSFFKIDSIMKSILRTYLTVTENIKTTETKEIDEINARKYVKTVAIQACKNMATLAFKTAERKLTDEQIGSAVMYMFASSFNDSEKTGKCKSLNTALLDIFGKELFAFLTAEGLNTKVGEKILVAVNESTKRVNLDDYIGSNVCAYKGHGVIESEDKEISITFENKKANLDGTIEKIGHAYYVVSDKEFVEENLSAGIYVPVVKESFVLKDGITMDDFTNVSFRCKFVDENSSKKFNCLVGLTKSGHEVVVAEFYINSTAAKLLEAIKIDKENIRFFISEKSICAHFLDEKLMTEIDLTSEIADKKESNVSMFSFNPLISIPTEMNEAATTIDEQLKITNDEAKTKGSPKFPGVQMPKSLS